MAPNSIFISKLAEREKSHNHWKGHWKLLNEIIFRISAFPGKKILHLMDFSSLWPFFTIKKCGLNSKSRSKHGHPTRWKRWKLKRSLSLGICVMLCVRCRKREKSCFSPSSHIILSSIAANWIFPHIWRRAWHHLIPHRMLNIWWKNSGILCWTIFTLIWLHFSLSKRNTTEDWSWLLLKGKGIPLQGYDGISRGKRKERRNVERKFSYPLKNTRARIDEWKLFKCAGIVSPFDDDGDMKAC